MGSIELKPRLRWQKVLLWSGLAVFLVGIGVAIASWLWYSQQLEAVDETTDSLVRVAIESNTNPGEIATILKDEGVIRNRTAFLIYTRLEGVQGKLQAGVYRLSPAETMPEIVAHLVSGKVDTFTVLFYPGATLVDNTPKAEDKKQDVTSSLRRAGYSDEQIKEGLAADYSDYNDTLFQGKPVGSDLEGYIYGDTYQLSSGATVEDVLRSSLNKLWSVIQENDLVEKYRARGLSLFEGITLASIIQKEAIDGDESKIAQVFLTRLSIDMPLGSDVTYQYIADKQGLARDPGLVSPYNTRRVQGLTPGPISQPGIASLKAVGSPSDSDYLYFLSGDDDVTYFARSLSEHEANIVKHCQQKCQIL